MSVKILIIEDEIHIRRLLMQTVELSFDELIDNDELEIYEADNGEDGVKIAKEERPDLIFSDIMMPKMNGYDACKIIKDDPDLKGVYVVLLTAKGQKVDQKRGMETGADEYMTKPFDPDNIVVVVEHVLKINRTS